MSTAARERAPEEQLTLVTLTQGWPWPGAAAHTSRVFMHQSAEQLSEADTRHFSVTEQETEPQRGRPTGPGFLSQ